MLCDGEFFFGIRVCIWAGRIEGDEVLGGLGEGSVFIVMYE